MDMIVAYNRANHCGGLFLIGVKGKTCFQIKMLCPVVGVELLST
jgi:hypothetical protein